MRQFREDARAATTWDLTPDSGDLCRFHLPTGAVAAYRQDGDAMLRLRMDKDQTPTRERYVMLPNTVCDVAAVIDSSDATFVQLTIDMALDDRNEEVRRRYRTIVLAGADQRFSN